MTDRFRSSTFLFAMLAAVAVAACDDDDGTGPTPSLSTPSGVTAAAQGETSIQLTWSAVTGAASYIVERAQGATGGTFAQVATPAAATYTDNGLTAGTTYRYRVAATAGTQTSAFSTEATATTSTPAGPKVADITTNITSNRTLYADTVYTLKGFIKVANGATLTIQAGTRIEGDFETLGSSLFVLRGARIQAVGTAAAPIVFTSSRAAGQRQPGDWGGLIIVGNARVNRGDPVILEGTGTGASNPEVNYAGGTDDSDNSGELRYVRVEFAGFATAQDAELNSFTFAAVGSGTRMSHLQALAGLDDHYEWFGGTADATHLVSYESGDDHFDMSEGFRGRLQHLIAYQSKVLVPRAGAGNVSSDPQGIENDGCAGANCLDGQNSLPLTQPLVANFTLVGTGPGIVDATSGGNGMVIRRGAAGYYVNGIVTRFPKGALSLRDAATETRATDGDLVIRNILSVDNGVLFEAGTGRFTVDAVANQIEEAAGAAATLFSVLPSDPSAPDNFNWTPVAGSPALSGGLATFTGDLAAKAGTVVTGTEYRGAAPATGPNANWWVGWTNYADN
jgi:hypothetical protein